MTPIEWSLAASGLCYISLEYWLGRTERVKAGSVVEALLNGTKYVCGFVFRRKL